MKDLCNKNYKTLMEATKEGTNRWKQMQRYLMSLIRRITIVKVSTLSKASSRLNAMPTQILRTYFTEI
jgi:hypothetical protein